MNAFKLSSIVIGCVAVSLLIRSCNTNRAHKNTRSPAFEKAPSPSPKDPESLLPSGVTKPEKESVGVNGGSKIDTHFPEYKGWEATLVGTTPDKVKDGDIVTIRYTWIGQGNPSATEMIPVCEAKRNFTGSVIYDGIAGPKNLSLKLKAAWGVYSILEDDEETVVPKEAFEKLMGTFTEVKVTPADNKGLSGYIETQQIVDMKSSWGLDFGNLFRRK